MKVVKMIFTDLAEREQAFNALIPHYRNDENVLIDRDFENEKTVDVFIYYDNTIHTVMANVRKHLFECDKILALHGKEEVTDGIRISNCGVTLDEDDIEDELELVPAFGKAMYRWFTISEVPNDLSRSLFKLFERMYIEYEEYYDATTNTFSIDIHCTRNDVDDINQWIVRNS